MGGHELVSQTHMIVQLLVLSDRLKCSSVLEE